MALKTIVSKGKKILKGLKGDKRTKVGRTIESVKTKVKKAVTPKKSTVKTQPVKPQPVKPRTIDFSKAKRTLATTAGVSAGVGAGGTALYMAGKSDNKKSETPKKVIDATGSKTFKQSFSEARKGGQKEFTWNGKKYNTKLASDTKPAKVDYQDANPNKSNAPNPFKKNDSDNKEKFDRMQAARDQMKRARESMGMGSRFGYKKGGSVKRNMRDGCAVRGKTKGKLY
jgi:hypothetical protein